MYVDFLLTTAEVSGALLGFVGVVLVLGRRSEGVLSNRDRSGLFHLVYAATGALFYSLLIYLLVTTIDQSVLAWRIGVGLCTLHIAFGVSKAIREGKSGDNRLNALARNGLSVLTFAVIGANLAIILGYLLDFAAVAFAVSITLMLAVAVSYFIPFILGKADDAT